MTLIIPANTLDNFAAYGLFVIMLLKSLTIHKIKLLRNYNIKYLNEKNLK